MRKFKISLFVFTTFTVCLTSSFTAQDWNDIRYSDGQEHLCQDGETPVIAQSQHQPASTIRSTGITATARIWIVLSWGIDVLYAACVFRLRSDGRRRPYPAGSPPGPAPPGRSRWWVPPRRPRCRSRYPPRIRPARRSNSRFKRAASTRATAPICPDVALGVVRGSGPGSSPVLGGHPDGRFRLFPHPGRSG